MEDSLHHWKNAARARFLRRTVEANRKKREDRGESVERYGFRFVFRLKFRGLKWRILSHGKWHNIRWKFRMAEWYRR